MAKVMYIEVDRPLPTNGNHVEIVPAGKGFMANGSVAYIEPRPHLVVFNPPVFETLDEAIAQSIAWADRHSVADVYVRKAVDATRT